MMIPVHMDPVRARVLNDLISTATQRVFRTMNDTGDLLDNNEERHYLMVAVVSGLAHSAADFLHECSEHSSEGTMPEGICRALIVQQICMALKLSTADLAGAVARVKAEGKRNGH